jgi:hypothetical protein
MSDKYNSYIAKILGKINGYERFAITISSTCTLYSVSENEITERWRKHEDRHKLQYKQNGWFKFVFLYLYYLIRDGYTNNPFEIDARAAEYG